MWQFVFAIASETGSGFPRRQSIDGAVEVLIEGVNILVMKLKTLEISRIVRGLPFLVFATFQVHFGFLTSLGFGDLETHTTELNWNARNGLSTAARARARDGSPMLGSPPS